jgi:hypothetical protein
VWQISEDFLSLKWIIESKKSGHVCPRKIHAAVIRRKGLTPWPNNFSSITMSQQFTARYHELYGFGEGGWVGNIYIYTIPLFTIFGSKYLLSSSKIDIRPEGTTISGHQTLYKKM